MEPVEGSMAAATDMVNFQQQSRRERAEVIQQVRTELNGTVHGKLDRLNGIATARQMVSEETATSEPYRLTDLIPGHWEGKHP